MDAAGELQQSGSSPRPGQSPRVKPTPPPTWQQRVAKEPGWHERGLESVAEAQDSYTGRRTREFLVKYTTVRENEMPRTIAANLEHVDLESLLELNNTRFFSGRLKASSRLKLGTKLLIPTGARGDQGEFTDGEVRATNYQLWLVEHSDGEVVELLASEVQEAVWCYRRITEGWTVATDAPHMGARVRRVFPDQKDPLNPDQPYSVNGTLVGYLPPGESDDDFAMWHMVHDGGDDDEDLDTAEVEEGVKCFAEYTARPPAPVKPATAPSAAPKKEQAAGKDAAAEKGKRKKRDKNAPKNPRTPFVFFHSKVRSDMIEEDPDTTFGMTGKQAGQLWREMDAEAKAPFVAMADEDKLRYAKDMETYVPPVEEDEPPPSKKLKGKGAQSAVVLVDSSSSSSSESDSESSSESEPDSGSETLGFGFIIVAVLLVACFATYNDNDPSLFNQTSSAPTNLLGYFGAYTADMLHRLLGASYWTLPVLFLVWGLRASPKI